MFRSECVIVTHSIKYEERILIMSEEFNSDMIDETLTEEKSEKKSDVFGIVVIILIVTLIAAFIVGFVAVTIWGVKSLVSSYNDVKSHNAAIEEVSAGTIYDKEIVNSETVDGGGFIYSSGKPGYYFGGDKEYIPTRYRIHISFEYDYNGKKYQGTKYYDVSEEIYISYSIGDYFDSKNFKK